MMTMIGFSRSALLLVSLALAFAAAAPATAAGEIQSGASGIHYGVSTTPTPGCTLGKAAITRNWLEANGVAVEGGPPRRMRLDFGTPTVTDTVRVAMNEVGFRDLALIEIEDTKGGWHTIWEGHMGATTPGFPQSCYENQFGDKQVVQALRFTFRDAPGEIEVNHAALLRR
jgi:hypothetical protein